MAFNSTIISGKDRYSLYEYKSEAELEKFVVNNFKELFDENTYYFNIKRKITSKAGKGTIPDGYAINIREKKLYVVEVELIKHDLRKHVRDQILNFMDALDNPESKEKIIIELIEEFKKNKIKINNNIIKEAVSNWGILIIIDEVGDPMKEVNPLLEVVNRLSQLAEVITIPFKTYVRKTNKTFDYIHLFNSFTKKELEEESKKWTFKWTTVCEDEHLKILSSKMKDIFIDLDNKIKSLNPQIKKVNRKKWITYQLSSLKNFCTIKFFPEKIEIYLKDNNNSFIDKYNLCENIKRTPAWTFDKLIIIDSKNNDIEKIVNLIEQSYLCLC